MYNSIESGHLWQTPCIRLKGSDRRRPILTLVWNFGEHNFNHLNEFVSISELLQSRKDETPMKSIKSFYSVYLLHQSRTVGNKIVKTIVKVYNVVLFFQ